MKTPRELLLGQHQSADDKLDKLRQEVVSALAGGDEGAEHPRRTPQSFWTLRQALWRELVWPYRKAWSCLAAAWVLIVMMNVAEKEPLVQETAGPVPASPQMVAALQEQEKLRAELLGEPAPAAPRTAGPRPRNNAPPPRSERQRSMVWV